MNKRDLQEQIKSLKKENTVYQAQSRMLEHFVSVARASADQKMIRATLQKTLEVSIDLVSAEKGSLFLLDEEGVVVESILTRLHTSSEERTRLVATIMEQGLAGWVRRHCNIEKGNCRSVCICDTDLDNRWLTLPGQPYKVRSVLVVPIIRKDKLLGLLTLLHSRPEHFGAESIDLIEMTAVQIGVVLENAIFYSKLEESFHRLTQAKKEIEGYSSALDIELEKGRKIQRDFLPEKIPLVSGWDITAFLQPAIPVSGDFYDVFELPRHCLALIIADVCDKGVGAALFMALFRSLLRVYTFGIEMSDAVTTGLPDAGGLSLLKAVCDTNSYITCHHGKLGMFATMFVGALNVNSGHLSYINAGHEPPVILTPEGKIGMLLPTGPAVGLLPEINFIAGQVQLNPGDTLIAFTDGVTEASSPADKIMGRKRLHSALSKKFSSAEETVDYIKRYTFDHMAHAPQNDDITVLCVRRKTL
ncbi:MAG: GAF domain-containing SpoIIE family protein phosphatase [Desulfobacterales bacterium]